jgi:helicase
MSYSSVSEPQIEAWLSEKLSAWGISELTDIQKKALIAGVARGENLVISAPTSSGKTLVAEIAALAALRAGMRVLYLVSHRALADQKYLDFSSRFGAQSASPVATVGLSTGDRTDGDVDAQLRVATYEKAIALLLSGQVRPESTLVVADELQIICDTSRGADIETLCAIFKQRKVKQFVALTATVENPADLAGWMQCTLVQSFERSTPLHQEIRYGGQTYSLTFGQDLGSEAPSFTPNHDLLKVVSDLVTQGRGPVLVFTETRKEALQYAADFVMDRPRTTSGLALADQLELFSEPTDASDKLRNYAERCVAFHTADLSAQERQVLEAGFAKSEFEVCFATSTLAAGVNYPFRTIVFPKLTFQYRDPGNSKLGLSDYRNMSGRAGRLGLHDDGFAILLPRNAVELAHVRHLILPVNETLKSVLLSLSLRKTLLSLVASRVANSLDAIAAFFENTLYWYQTLERNPQKLSHLQSLCQEAVKWLVKNDLLLDDVGELRITQLGKATALSGLLPDTAVSFANILRACSVQLALSFEQYSDGLIYVCCASSEFRGEKPSRFLPYASSEIYGALDFWRTRKVPIKIDTADSQLAQSAQAIAMYVTGELERKIAYATGLSAGSLQRLALDTAWVLEGLHRISTIGDLGCPQAVSNQIGLLSRRVRWGVPVETLDLLRVAERHRVPGVGRQRAMALVKQGFNTLQDVLYGGKQKLLDVLKSSLRVEALLAGAATMAGHNPNHMHSAHCRVAEKLGILSVVDRCYQDVGVEYEKAVLELFHACGISSAKTVDNGLRQNVPDLLLKVGEHEAFIECKTATKSPALVNKEDAWAVIQKASDFASHVRRITLGKPAFDETSKKKAAATSEITLVENGVLIEALLRVKGGGMSAEQFMLWLCPPGVAEIERLPGDASYSL